jgi:hypothetical protein
MKTELISTALMKEWKGGRAGRFVLVVLLVLLFQCLCFDSWMAGGVLFAEVADETPAATGDSAPAIACKNVAYDFGFAGPNQVIKHAFECGNTGSALLKISKLDAGCGCMAGVLPGDEIPPGEVCTIEVSFETGAREGTQEKKIRMVSNDPNSPEIDFSIKGTVKRDLAVSPHGVHFGQVESGSTASGRVRIYQLSDETLIVSKMEVNDRYFEVSSSRFREENSRGINLDIALRSDAPSGAIDEVITLYTNQKKYSRIDIPVRINIIDTGRKKL